MFGTSGIRGAVGETVTAELALAAGRALGVDTDRVVVGRDARETGTFLLDSVVAGLRESGVAVIDTGFAATPTVARAVEWADADAGVVVTASHNPPKDNGLKFWQRSGQAFDEPLQEKIAERITGDVTDLVSASGVGERTSETFRESHRDAIVATTDISTQPTVVVDLGNGAGGITIDALEKLECHVETLNAQPDGSFPGRPSEPTADNCKTLSAAVAGTDANLGIAHDGDADRMRAVDEDGEFLSGDMLLAILAGEAASPGETVAVPVDTSLAVEDYLAERSIETTRTPVGDVYVAAAASKSGVAFGGEPSGAWIWPNETLCPDGPLAACKIAALAGRQPLSERRTEIPTYPIHRDNIDVSDKRAVMHTVRNDVEADYDNVSTLDGVRVGLGDAWFLIRASGTEPLVRITAEARDETRAETVLKEAQEILAAAIARSTE